MHPLELELGILGFIVVVALITAYTMKRNPKAPPGDPLVALVLGWCIPGAGHWVLGQRGKAIFFFLAIMLTFAAGVVLADFRNVKNLDNEFYWAGQLGSGLIYLIANIFIGHVPAGRMPIEWYEIGLLYICVAGMLNIVLLLNLFNLPAAQPVAGSGAPPAPAKEGA